MSKIFDPTNYLIKGVSKANEHAFSRVASFPNVHAFSRVEGFQRLMYEHSHGRQTLLNYVVFVKARTPSIS